MTLRPYISDDTGRKMLSPGGIPSLSALLPITDRARRVTLSDGTVFDPADTSYLFLGYLTEETGERLIQKPAEPVRFPANPFFCSHALIVCSQAKVSGVLRSRRFGHSAVLVPGAPYARAFLYGGLSIGDRAGTDVAGFEVYANSEFVAESFGCPAGQSFDDATGQCTSKCVPGQAARSPFGDAGCTRCGAGTYCSEPTGCMSCSLCPVNTYVDVKGSPSLSSCIPCGGVRRFVPFLSPQFGKQDFCTFRGLSRKLKVLGKRTFVWSRRATA